MFVVTYAGLSFLWLPFVLLRQADALLMFVTPAQLWLDIALALLLLAVPAIALASLTLLLAGLSRALRMADPVRTAVSWLIVFVPLAWLCSWQIGGTAWLWFKTVSDTSPTLGSGLRLGLGLALLAALIAAGRRYGLGAIGLKAIQALLALRNATLTSLSVSVFALLIWPPARLHGPTQAAAPAQAGAPDIILISIDTLAAADAGACDEKTRSLMPRLHEFSQSASCFSRFYASSNFTTPTTSTMETGLLPWSHKATQVVASITPEARQAALPASLRSAGYSSYSVSANLLASPRQHGTYKDYDQVLIARSSSIGMQLREWFGRFPESTLAAWGTALFPMVYTYDIHAHAETHPYDPRLSYHAAHEILKRHEASRPAFLWVHTMPPHDPYLPPASTKYRLLPPGQLDRWADQRIAGPYLDTDQPSVDKHRLRYQESIMGADQALGEFLDQLALEGRLDRALVIITSDHGESFEKRLLGHGTSAMHNALLHVPLLIKLPGQAHAHRIDTPVSQADLAPTIADYAGVRPAIAMDGRSLRPALATGQIDARPVYAMSMERQSRFAPLTSGHFVVVDGRYKLIHHREENRNELFDLEADPAETTDLFLLRPELLARLSQLLESRLATWSQMGTSN
ncbi:sulfatase-like hydrolase/transferase [Paucibacter soli]|uniref:sulfatase-like hydrolase/transferase n=1 Tax=Paucibacter soli TaxID=3133433 RepID=UPI00309F67E6